MLAKITESTGKVRFWQPGGGYDRNIVSNDEMREKIEYIHSNPVRRGLAESPTGYRWSSARWYAGDRDSTPSIDAATKPV